MQQLKTEIVIQIPETHVLIEKTEFEQLEKQADVTWVKGLEWLKEQTGIRSTVTLRENILYPHRDQLETIVDYPDNAGGVWRFNAQPTKQWLRNNFKRVLAK